MIVLSLMALTVWSLSSGSNHIIQPKDDLESGFFNPPAQAKPHTWWHCMSGNITREGITADLEAMAKAGIGGAQIFNVSGSHGTNIPDGGVDYLSKQWLEKVKYAASEAKRLGLELAIHNCAGWATTGGPWVTPEYAMQQLVTTEIDLWGGRRIEQILPHPQVFENHYRDIAVFAFPSGMDSDYRVDQWPQKAGQRGGRPGRQPDLGPTPEGAEIQLDTIINISSFMREDGTLVWDVPHGRWRILRIGHTPTGSTNHPAHESGQGLEIDKLRREGLDIHWKEGIQPILDYLGPLAGNGSPLNNILVDSYEAGLHHWTPHMREEFIQRRGYDPTPYLLALTGRLIEDAATTERFLWDFRRTISDLFADNYYGYFADLSHQHGMRFSTEPYTSCFEGLAVAAKADIPMGEFWVDGGYFHTLRMAASIARTNGRNIAGAEAFTAAPHLGRWQNHPGKLKALGDRAWSEGINRFIFHTFSHQPLLEGLLPGMTMGQYGIHFDRTNTWWEPGREWIRYIARSQHLLQAGEFVADVLCYAGDAAPNGGVNRPEIKLAGYDYDACGTDIFLQLEVENGNIVLPSGKQYRLLILPDTEFMRSAFARKVRELVRDGATVLGPKPKHTPSLQDFPDSEKEVVAIGEEVWGPCDGIDITSNRYGKGQVFSGVSPREVLQTIDVQPALNIRDDSGDLAWIQRRTDEADIYFISNQSDERIQTTAGFRVLGKIPEIWNAEAVSIRQAAGWTVTDHHTWMPLDLMPGKSVFVVFRRNGVPGPDPYVRVIHPEQRLLLPGQQNHWLSGLTYDNGLHLQAWHDGTYTLQRTSGEAKQITVSGLSAPLELAHSWNIRFQPGRGAPEQAHFDSLLAWEKHPDPRIRHFSGTARNTLVFDLPEGFLRDDQQVWLDLGEVAVIARVTLNDTDLGVVWHKPFRLEVSHALRQGSNKLEVDVTNLWINRLIGDEQHPEDVEWVDGGDSMSGSFLKNWPEWVLSGQPRPVPERVTFTTWKHYQADDLLVPSGLIGPVTLNGARMVRID